MSAAMTMVYACGVEFISLKNKKSDCHAELALKQCSRYGSACCAVLSIYGKAVSWKGQNHLMARSWFTALTLSGADELYRSMVGLQSALAVFH